MEDPGLSHRAPRHRGSRPPPVHAGPKSTEGWDVLRSVILSLKHWTSMVCLSTGSPRHCLHRLKVVLVATSTQLTTHRHAPAPVTAQDLVTGESCYRLAVTCMIRCQVVEMNTKTSLGLAANSEQMPGIVVRAWPGWLSVLGFTEHQPQEQAPSGHHV